MKIKNLFIVLVLAFLVGFSPPETEAQQGSDYYVLMSDTISNSQLKTQVVDLAELGRWDSLKATVIGVGEIDLDSLRVQGGTEIGLTSIRGADKDTLLIEYEALTVVDVTINAADGASVIEQAVMTLYQTSVIGYNKLKFFLRAASSGNDATDETQTYVVVLQIYRNYFYQE